jgi:thiosulfate/3-mercaptopyruvate sulfurtransferase
MRGKIEPLVSTSWLYDNLNNIDLRILDASWYLPNEKRRPNKEYCQAHIPGAMFFDIDEFSNQNSNLPHMAPPLDQFKAEIKKMGIGDDHHVIVYDGSGLFSAARAWWLFKFFGKVKVSVLDGGFPKWSQEERPVSVKIINFEEANINLVNDSRMISGWQRVQDASISGSEQIIDARSEGRFKGKDPEPRPGLRSGHIPGSINICYSELLNVDKTFKTPSEIKSIFLKRGINLKKPIITSCGSGVTAAIVNLALELVETRHTSLYDGSWCEWGGNPELDLELD